MKATVVVVVVVVAAVAVGRRRRHRGAAGAQRPTALLGRRPWRDRRPLGNVGPVAAREIRERLRSRTFRVVTALLFLGVAAAVVVPTLHGSANQTERIGVVGRSAVPASELTLLARTTGLSTEVVPEPDLAAARSALARGQLDVVVDDEALVVENPVPATDTSASARYLRLLATTSGEQRAFSAAGLTPRQAAIVAGARPLPIESIHPPKPNRTVSESTALIGVILIFVVLTQYLTWILTGVMEEKSSRVVEVLLATVRPLQLLAGKVLGIGTVALLQALSLVVFALALAKGVGSELIRGAAPLVVAATLAWLVLGYAFYSWLYAAAGSLGERQDQVQSLALPLSAPLILGYVVALSGLGSGSPSLLLRVLAYLPPTAPFAMPALVGFEAVAWWQFLLSVLVSLAGTTLVASVAAWLYREAVLRTGARVRIRQLLAGNRRAPSG